MSTSQNPLVTSFYNPCKAGFLIPPLAIPGVKIVLPEERAAIGRLGDYHRYAKPRFHVVPFIEQINRVNISEQMVNVEPSDMITKEYLNA
ncbi:hypothetical protein [Haloarcula marismortui]|uniref:Band 7 domain-containing protein n=1 Tax=Haloarcula marismortui (strain ATCC 43049 / DSM 3752 / JCM 8966 / VKM B-1809) TaxID=272569 RepID=A0A4P8JUF5_HALMA|nr:hypothetical protein [Haloarcula marismortui]QCP89634.1 hypothetical protein E6P14_01615 [Haloarcula marismortui ATCC 43049]